jgi:hypothetical protein
MPEKKYIDIFRDSTGEYTRKNIKVVRVDGYVLMQQSQTRNTIWSKMAQMGLEVVQVYKILPGKDKDKGIGVYVEGKFIKYEDVNEKNIFTG